MQSVRLNDIYEAHKDNIEFFLIYVCEAHPSDGWQTPQNLYEEVVYTAPGERVRLDLGTPDRPRARLVATHLSVLESGTPGAVYNVGADNEQSNLALTHSIIVSGWPVRPTQM